VYLNIPPPERVEGGFNNIVKRKECNERVGSQGFSQVHVLVSFTFHAFNLGGTRKTEEQIHVKNHVDVKEEGQKRR